MKLRVGTLLLLVSEIAVRASVGCGALKATHGEPRRASGRVVRVVGPNRPEGRGVVFLLRPNPTGAILFMGRVANPGA